MALRSPAGSAGPFVGTLIFSTIYRSRQQEWSDQTLDQAFELPEVLVAGQHLASVLQEGRENANIDAGLGFIWRISDKDIL